MDNTPVSILILEPNKVLDTPYIFLPSMYTFLRFPSIEKGITHLPINVPHLILLSASFAPAKIVLFLETVKNASLTSLSGIIFVVDLTNRLNFIPGTTWAGKIAVLDTNIPQRDFASIVNRIYHI